MESLNPPRVAAFCLELLYPASLHEAVAGDLAEEFQLVCTLAGRRAAHAWYRRQVVRSAGYAIQRRWQAGDFLNLLTAAALGLAILWLVTAAGHFVLSQVPRKAAPQLPPAYEYARWLLATVLPGLGLYWWRLGRGEKLK